MTAECPLTDDELKHILAERNDDSYVKKKWFRGIHVLNLDNVRQIKEWMEEVTSTLIRNVFLRRHIKRSKKREDHNVEKSEGSRMVAIGVNVDQSGYLRPPHNTGGMEEDLRFELLQESDYVLDGIVFVYSLFLSRLMLDS